MHFSLRPRGLGTRLYFVPCAVAPASLFPALFPFLLRFFLLVAVCQGSLQKFDCGNTALLSHNELAARFAIPGMQRFHTNGGHCAASPRGGGHILRPLTPGEKYHGRKYPIRRVQVLKFVLHATRAVKAWKRGWV